MDIFPPSLANLFTFRRKCFPHVCRFSLSKCFSLTVALLLLDGMRVCMCACVRKHAGGETENSQQPVQCWFAMFSMCIAEWWFFSRRETLVWYRSAKMCTTFLLLLSFGRPTTAAKTVRPCHALSFSKCPLDDFFSQLLLLSFIEFEKQQLALTILFCTICFNQNNCYYRFWAANYE